MAAAVSAGMKNPAIQRETGAPGMRTRVVMVQLIKDGDGHDKGDRAAHAQGHVHLPGNADKRADADKIIQHEIVDQGRADGDQEDVDQIIHAVILSPAARTWIVTRIDPVDQGQQQAEGQKSPGRQHHDDPVGPGCRQHLKTGQHAGAQNFADRGDAGQGQAEPSDCPWRPRPRP